MAESLQFITAIPWNVRLGSGCYVGTKTLVEGLRCLGARVSLITPRINLHVFTATRLLFNETLRFRDLKGLATVGIDADGYSIAGRMKSVPHAACIKGVLGDAVRFESGATRASLALHAKLEAMHARRADLVITISRYCAGRLEELYGVKGASVVPEVIDLDAWRRLFRMNPATPDPRKFTVLSVCRFYPRKRLNVLLQAAAFLRDIIPGLEVRIVGNGPEYRRLHQMHVDLGLEKVVHWLGDLPLSSLAREYNRADVFCLPSIQEGFGIVFLEAMAAVKPIVASRAGAVPEVVRNGILVEPDNPDALAEGLARIYFNPDLRYSLAAAGSTDVDRYDVSRIAQKFLLELTKIAPQVLNLIPSNISGGELATPGCVRP